MKKVYSQKEFQIKALTPVFIKGIRHCQFCGANYGDYGCSKECVVRVA